ncbi:hypothetical protein B0H14DRAFT_3462322 [Mycena olivaceomarginata]|nr:hypothetical protein B0H14DRAFT_3462322 [Mycena olivaceomarginata]
MNLLETVNQIDWIAQGKFWASVPPRIKRVAAEYFTLPQELEFELLPSPHLSIAKMLEFPLPLQNNLAMAAQPAQFFSINPPNIITDKNLLIRMCTISEDDSDVAEEAFTESDLYKDCDTPLNVVADLLHSCDAPAVVTNFKVTEEGGITRSGDAGLPDAEGAKLEAHGHGLRKKTAARHWNGALLIRLGIAN